MLGGGVTSARKQDIAGNTPSVVGDAGSNPGHPTKNQIAGLVAGRPESS